MVPETGLEPVSGDYLRGSRLPLGKPRNHFRAVRANLFP